ERTGSACARTTENEMPLAETLQRFIARVEENAHVEAIRDFYADHASMRENQGPPRTGRDRLMAHESQVMARAASVESTWVHPVLREGDVVVIRWRFRFVWRDGRTTQMEELAYQRWEGERIVDEQFFYDPAQRAPRPEPASDA